jgi:N-succinyldiaminopimelate aminotransferase
MDPIAKAHQWLTFTTPPNLQKAVAYGLGKDDGYFRDWPGSFMAKRDRMAAGLAGLGFTVLPCAATYFLTCDISGLGLGDNDVEVCEDGGGGRGCRRAGFGLLWGRSADGNFIRFCFCKQDDVIDEALTRLSAWMTPAAAGAVGN